MLMDKPYLSDATLVKDYQHLLDNQMDGEESFRIIYDSLRGKVYGIAQNILENHHDSEEVVQKTMMNVWESTRAGSRSRFKGDSKFSKWVCSVALNVARNKYKSRLRRGYFVTNSIDAPLEDAEGNPNGQELSDEGLNPHQEYELSELERRATSEMTELPEIYRGALALRQMSEGTYEELAGVLGIKVGTLKSRISRAKDEIRRKLK